MMQNPKYIYVYILIYITVESRMPEAYIQEVIF
jgi:hypothetical protein